MKRKFMSITEKTMDPTFNHILIPKTVEPIRQDLDSSFQIITSFVSNP